LSQVRHSVSVGGLEVVQQLGDLVELAEGVLVIAILAVFAWAAFTAVSDFYSPVFRLLHGS
jgi:hypothetical protein